MNREQDDKSLVLSMLKMEQSILTVLGFDADNMSLAEVMATFRKIEQFCEIIKGD